MGLAASLSSSATRRLISVAHAASASSSTSVSRLSSSDPARAARGLSRERESVLETLCGFAFHGPVLAAGALPTGPRRALFGNSQPVSFAGYLTQRRGGGGRGGGARAASSLFLGEYSITHQITEG
jgi:hypothetical protein